MSVSDIPIPPRMAHLAKDARGYPIPAGVFRDRGGKPHFTVNDEEVRVRQLVEDRCPICDAPLDRNRWFVGGPRSAFDKNGCYIDLPMHDECMRYALQVCPYLAAPHYGKRIDAKTISDNDPARLFISDTVIPERPVIFVCVLTRGQRQHGNGWRVYLAPKRPYLRTEFWQHGQRLPFAEGKAIAAQILATPLPARQAPRLVRSR